MQTLGILLLALVAQDANADGYYKFPKGTTWTFDKLEGEKKNTVVLTVRGEEEGRIVVDSDETKNGEDKEPTKTKLIWYMEKGHLHWGKRGKGEVESMFAIFKTGSKKGDTWAGTEAGNNFTLTATHMGETAVETPYKKFRKAIHVKLSAPGGNEEALGFTFNFYLIDGIGVVKMELEMEGQKSLSLQLREFKKG